MLIDIPDDLVEEIKKLNPNKIRENILEMIAEKIREIYIYAGMDINESETDKVLSKYEGTLLK